MDFGQSLRIPVDSRGFLKDSGGFLKDSGGFRRILDDS